MSTFTRRYPVLLSVLVVAVTIVFVALSLVVGRASGADQIALDVGEPSPETFIATREIEIEDDAATQAEREFVAENVPAVFAIDLSVKPSVKANLAAFFEAVREAAFDESVVPPPVATTTTIAPTTTATIVLPEEDTVPPAEEAVPPDGETVAPDGDTVPPDEETVAPDGVAPPEDTTTTTLAAPVVTEPPTTTTTTLPRVALSDQIAEVEGQFLTFGSAVDTIVVVYNDDLDRRAEGEREVLPLVEDAVEELVDTRMGLGIRSGDLLDVQTGIEGSPVDIFLPGLTFVERTEVRQAVASIVARSLQANDFVDDAATDQAKQDAVAEVAPVIRTFFADAPIIQQGARIGQVELNAIIQLELLQPQETTPRFAIAVLGAVAVLLAAFFLWRIAPGQWSEPRHFALLGVLLVLAALASRIPEILVPDETPELGFVLPAVMFGYLAAILYDPRTAVLLSVPVAMFAAVSTQDPALTMFAAAATITPVAFVSSVSSRRELRVAVGLSAVVLAPLAGSVAWLFLGADAVLLAALFGLVGGVIAGLIAQGLLSFLENLFRVTTTVTLLDLADRNHPALRLLEEKAPGTFNHSILVGTLAGKAARAIGADPLLAQAAAYYHDLGKTEQPGFFIENQFGFFNPHDELDPAESAQIIRQHVTDGLRLARQHRIPEDVSDGIRMHHGTGLMRYFYHKALDEDASVDSAAYRHAGAKPRRKEMAILMLSDAVEGAARALAQHDDPSADGMRKLVESIVGEKLEDGQLDESDLTFGDLTRVKLALVEALIGYYHTRIVYPGFPSVEGDTPPALGDGNDEAP